MSTEWIMTALTAAYTLLTILIVISNYFMAKATNQQVAELRKQFEEQNRPYICIRFQQIRSGLLCLAIENTGNSPARDVIISINEAFIDKISHEKFNGRLHDLTKSSIFLSPAQAMYCTLGVSSNFDRIKAQPLIADLTYTGNGREYQEHIEIDISAYRWALVYDSPLGDISTRMKDISETLIKIENKIH